ncbi:hypothetical protein KR222_009528 [Zaprionus bogoriensis]|nr:hypothetical protein KR222_009528 [Zaprionus bogoriensis]
MRALFRCSELSDLVSEFIGRGVQCALESLLSDEWAERNCATLLLSALTVRIFGVERARNDAGQLHVRNRMTGRIFFTRYPQLFDYFHACLRQAALQQQQQAVARGQATAGTSGQTVQLEALLQLLSRLYPSALEGTECTLNLSEFVPFLQEICFVHDNMTRQRASQVLANFMEPRDAFTRIRRICMQLKVMLHRQQKTGNFGSDYNGLHGHLLQLLELYGVVRWQQPQLVCLMMQTLAQLALSIYEQDMQLFSAAMDTLICSMQDAPDATHFGRTLMAALQAIYALEQARLYRRCREHALAPKFLQLFALHLHRLAGQQQQQPEELMLQQMQRDLIAPQQQLPASLAEFKVDLWLYLLLQQANNSPHTRGLVEHFELQHYQFDPDVIVYYRSLGSSAAQQLAQRLRASPALQAHVMQLAADSANNAAGWSPALGGRLYCLLALLDKLTPSVAQLLQEAERCGDEQRQLQPGLALCITRQLVPELAEQKSEYEWMPLLEYCLQIAAPSQPAYWRYRATRLMDRLTLHVARLIATRDARTVGTYMRLVLQLLVDESELVRNHTAEMVASCMSGSAEDALKFKLLPLVAEEQFLRSMLQALQRQWQWQSHADEAFDADAFVLGVFNLIVEPFVSAELLENPLEELDDELEVFDKQETNVYCEGLRVASLVMRSFRDSFAGNKELSSALDALENLCSFTG